MSGSEDFPAERGEIRKADAGLGSEPWAVRGLLHAYDAKVAENENLRAAAHYARATLRGMLSDPNVTRSIDLRPEIEMLDRALAREKVPDAMP